MPSAALIACHKVIKDNKLTIAFAESATAGRFSAGLFLISECGEILKGGIVCYDACISRIYWCIQEMVEKYTSESAEVTKQPAETA